MKLSWKACWFVTLITVVVLHFSREHELGAHSTDEARLLEVRGLVLRDKNGTVKARLEMKPDGSPSFSLLDSTQQKHIELSVSQEGCSTFALRSAKSNVSLWLSVEPDGAILISGVGSKGHIAFELAKFPDDTVQQFFSDQNGKKRLQLLTRPGGRTEACLFGAGERPGLWMRVSESGDVTQAFFDPNGTDRILTSLNSKGQSVTFFDPDRKRRWMSAVTPDGDSMQQFHDENGVRRIGFAVGSKGKADQALFGPSGEPRLFLSAEADQCSSLRICDAKGIPRIAFAVEQDGHTRGTLKPANDAMKAEKLGPSVVDLRIDR